MKSGLRYLLEGFFTGEQAFHFCEFLDILSSRIQEANHHKISRYIEHCDKLEEAYTELNEKVDNELFDDEIAF